MNDLKRNDMTAGVNYLGMNPTMQTKSNNFGTYKSENPLYFIWEGTDYDLPNNSVNNQPQIHPRYVPATYKVANPMTASEITHYKTLLNKFGADQVSYKHNELYGYSELLK